MAPNQLFATKSLQRVKDEMEGGGRLKRVLGPVSLTALGIGAVIGAGIFVATGAAAKEVAGPALMLSYVVAGITCIFAALCYAEFASMAPVAGSAYTYAYCTLGELFAWIIGWDLVLEYAVGAATVANGWSGYFQTILTKLGIIVPMMFCAAPITYDDGVFRPNVYGEYKATAKDAAGQAEGNIVRVRHKITSQDKYKLDAEGNPIKDQPIYKRGENGQPLVKHKPDGETVFKLDKKGDPILDAQGKPIPVLETEKESGLFWVLDSDEKVVLGKVGDPKVEKGFTVQQSYMNLPAILIVLIIAAVLIKGISESATFNAVMVAIKVLAVLFVIVVGWFYVKYEHWTGGKGFAPYGYGGFSFFGIPELTFGHVNENGRPVGMLAGAAIIFFAYIGFDAVSTQAEEAKKPERDVPIGIMSSLVICTILYIAVVAVLTGMVPYYDIDKDAGVSSAFKKIHLDWAEVIVAIAGVAGITSVLLVMMMSGPRVFLAMARDGLVPKKFFADVHPTFKTPWKSTIAIAIFVMILAGVLPIDALLHLTNIGTLFAFVIVCAAVLVMRRTNPTAERPFKVPLGPVIPILGIAMCLMLMLSLPLDNWYRLIGWLVIGLVIYFTYGRHHSVLGRELRGETTGEYQRMTTPASTPVGTPAPLAGGDEPGFHRKLTLFDATMLILGTMIGSGIFVVSCTIAQDVGSSGWLMGVWILAGLMTLMGALSYAELAGMMPQAGGQYIFLREAYSPMWGFLYGWTCFLVIQTGSIAAVAVVFAKYLGVLVPSLGTNVDKNALIGPWVVNWKLTLPYMTDPFFHMEKFGITSGQLVAVVVIVFLTWLNCRGVEEGKVVQNLFTVTKTLALTALILVGLSVALSVDVWNHNWSDPWSGIAATEQYGKVQKLTWTAWLGGNDMLVAFMVAGGAMVGALFAADAWNNITFTAGEIQNPRRNLPLSLALGAGLVIFLYLLANVAYLAALPVNGAPALEAKLKGIKDAEDSLKTRLKLVKEAGDKEKIAEFEQELKDKDTARKDALEHATPRERGIAQAEDERVATAVVETVSPTIGPYLMALAIMISTFGCVNGMTLMGARLYYAMARDGLFFKSVGGLNKQGVPAAGLVLQGIWSILLVFSGTYDDLLDFVIFAVLIFYVLTVAGLFILRWKMPNAERPTKAFGYPIVPALYVLLCLVICLDLLVVKPKYTWPGLAIVVTGIPVYFLWRIFGKKPETAA